MSDAPTRGGVYPYHGIRRGHFLVVSLDALNRAGTAIVAEISGDVPTTDTRALLAIRLADADPLPGSWVLCWHLNYLRTDRLNSAKSPGQVSPETMERVVGAIRAIVES
jgi:mRNA-degrading endonuclease toxin of MazEF toxin-antitoxin module